MHEVTSLPPAEIQVGERFRRSLNRESIDRLKESIAKIGLRTPISIRFAGEEEGYFLVAGRHRLQACIELGWNEVPVREETGSELDARLWEIAENLHRADLTALERDEHIAEWIRLQDEREAVSAQVAPKPQGGRPEGGIRAAARELGIEHTDAQRAVNVSSLAPEAKEEAAVLRLDDNRTALLKAARARSKEEQIRALREHAAARSEPRRPALLVDAHQAHASDRRVETFIRATKNLSDDEFTIACNWFDEYRAERGDTVFDRTRAGRK